MEGAQQLKFFNLNVYLTGALHDFEKTLNKNAARKISAKRSLRKFNNSHPQKNTTNTTKLNQRHSGQFKI